ncbi:MAG: ATP-dependent helicase [Lachnospiraceae bacterium]|nr:ATP-dependent helicase [Lachnospiraceae bacterium]
MIFSQVQTSAIMHVDGPMMVVAGPGSGKTATICRRIQYLIESAGVSPADILVISFTRAAALEMESRFKQLTIGCDYPVRFGTFHSIFFWIIKTAYNLGNSCVITEEEKRKILDRLMDYMSLTYDNKDEIISSIISQISIVKCDMIDIEYYYCKDMPEETFRQLYKRMGEEINRLGKIDFDDMMVMCYDLLVKRADILKKCQSIFKYIMVDEFQDSNRIQYEILKLLSAPSNNVFVVGDDDQSVYGFRGARPEIMHKFREDYPNTAVVFLGDNYRCDRLITKAATGVISGNKKRFQKEITSVSTENGLVEFISPKDVQKENELLVENIRCQFKQGIPYERQAVIFRTNVQPRRLVYKLNQYNIPYTISDIMPNIFDHFAVRNVLDYMRIAMGDKSRATLLRILNKPSRYISRDYLYEDPVNYDKLRWRMRDKDYAVDNLDKLMADIKLIKKMRPYPALNFIRKGIGYEDYLKKYAAERQLDESEFVDILDEFATMIVDMTSYGQMFEFIEEYTKLLQEQQEKSKLKKGVQLLTMHSSKGLEYDCVYIIDAIEGITPYKKARNSKEIEEERRMFYVAMTRARHKLYIYSPQLISGKPKEKSPFVADAEAAIRNREEK